MINNLDPGSARIRDMGAAAVQWMAAHEDGLRDLPVAPQVSAARLAEQLTEPLPRAGRDFATLLATFDEVIAAGSRHNGHPRFFGYVSAPGTAIASIADLLASALNANLPAWRSAPAPTELEHVTIDWIKQAIGLDPAAGGLLLSGGSMANLCALVAARHRRCGDTVAQHGITAQSRPLTVYVSADAHHSIHKAAALIGIGRANVRQVALDSLLRMDVADLTRQIDADRAAGADPLCVVATAGTVVTGAVDPLAAIAAIARDQGMWMHVDACYGGFARLAPSAAPLFDGIEQADSVALDPHKWLYLPADCGCLIYRDPGAVAGAFTLGTADYVRIMQDDAAEAFAFWEYGPELSRRFRALKVWMTIAHVGADGLAEAIDSNMDCARYLAELVDQSEDLEMVAPVGLSIFCLRYLPQAMRSKDLSTEQELELDRINEQIMLQVQRDGSSYLSNATVAGRFALRGCVLNYRTTRKDMEVLLHDVRRAAAHLGYR
ncbi:pyridoxal-dependent decarboxylase [Rhizocola hellebori]|uniref:Pyridoxal-dependent decarboxylase n=1 Tax=Rhizocola hellebori TaxID=1392758 RepID=A0A8J3Q9F4_9ACTN|nr:aminotransferase class V-fold PLP-dependent enzyme [Rhizocola hellebori]GIH05480.1 pyridoxal-dependent decarboxylase [Rhizocola hellebori]